MHPDPNHFSRLPCLWRGPLIKPAGTGRASTAGPKEFAWGEQVISLAWVPDKPDVLLVRCEIQLACLFPHGVVPRRFESIPLLVSRQYFAHTYRRCLSRLGSATSGFGSSTSGAERTPRSPRRVGLTRWQWIHTRTICLLRSRALTMQSRSVGCVI